ncbi:hypothetical protein IAW_05729 [Bacillus cereus str. Schrouff]|uniref:hypothetical protein n=1 Tax=Bacillus cereus TaxID=1396 RepID=UPI00032F9BD4|nr:hypothetical protein [Bacillus cereus]EOO04912.1 hypothetical protein IAW_05729 [Bacillus cereus str. Schrouff]EOO81550.1 hypothetical protein IGY_05776 [Bacillus cereus K-5975c]
MCLGYLKWLLNDVIALFRHTIQLFKGINHEQVISTLNVAPDPIDKMVEKEMAQLKAMKGEKKQEEMSKYKKQITSLEELHKVIDALETLNKKYVITKGRQKKEIIPTEQRYYESIWYAEEVDVLKKYSDGEIRSGYSQAECLVSGHMDKAYPPSKKEYQEVTVCPKCNGAFVDLFVYGRYKRGE